MPRFQYSRTAAISAALLAAWMLPALAQESSPVEGASTSMDAVQGQVQEPAQGQAEDPAQAKAQDQTAPKKPKKPYGGGTPVDVIMNNRLWTEAPEAKDFVRANRRPVDELQYQPTVGIDPERPKTKSKDELSSLRSELDDAAAHNSQAVGSSKKKADSAAAKKTKTVKKTTGTDKAN
jgi:hypothetical protein